MTEIDDVSTKRRLLDAAEQLFGERGYGGTSLRAITQLAGANVAAANYHWGGKDGLLRAVISRATEPVNTERSRRLDALLADPEPPTVEQLVRAFVEPGIDLTGHHGERAANVARFIAAVTLDPNPRIREIFADQVDPTEGRFLDALSRALPDHDPASVRFGYTSMVGLLALHQADALHDLARHEPDHPTRQRTRAELINFIAAGLTGR